MGFTIVAFVTLISILGATAALALLLAMFFGF